MKISTIKKINWFQCSLISLLCFRLFFLVISNLSTLTKHYDPDSTEQAYLHSQYNLGNAEFLGNIDDDKVYTYAGYKYIHGSDPSTIIPEVPYLMKYLYGISIFIFDNPVIIQSFLGLLLLMVSFHLSRLITSNTTLALISPLLISFDNLFTHQLFTPLLDLPHALFILLAVCSFYYASSTANNNRFNSNFIILASICIGLVATTKLYITAVILWICLLLNFPFLKQYYLKLTLPAVITYLFVHTIFFFYHPNPIDFIHQHINTIRLYRSYVPEYPWGQIFNILFRGHWLTWWGTHQQISVPQWSIFWPISFLGVVSTYLGILKNPPTHLSPITKTVQCSSLFILLYYLSNTIHLVFPRYILSVLPLSLIITVYNFQKFWQTIKK